MGVITKHVDMSQPGADGQVHDGHRVRGGRHLRRRRITSIPGIMEQVERAGVHSGDSISRLPALAPSARRSWIRMVDYTGRLCPRAERRGPGQRPVRWCTTTRSMSSRSTPVPPVPCPTSPRSPACRWWIWPSRCMLGEKLKDMGYGTGLWHTGKSPYYAVKVPVFSFAEAARRGHPCWARR